MTILATGRGNPELVEGINYVFDTLLFAGTALLIAAEIPRKDGESHQMSS